jgi:hypothetical protein
VTLLETCRVFSPWPKGVTDGGGEPSGGLYGSASQTTRNFTWFFVYEAIWGLIDGIRCTKLFGEGLFSGNQAHKLFEKSLFWGNQAPDSFRNWHLSNLYLKKKLIDAALCAQCQDKIYRLFADHDLTQFLDIAGGIIYFHFRTKPSLLRTTGR